MDPNELLHAAPAIAKGAGALAAAVPFTAIVKRVLGPAADEIAETWLNILVLVTVLHYATSSSMERHGA